VVLIAGVWWLSTVAFGPSSPAAHRLAVLPFANLMNDHEQEYFVEGMHDALVSELAQAGVGVIARTSVMQYRDTRKPVREIARELNVGTVIEGSVLRERDRVRIQVQLIDGATEDHLWARTYDGDLSGVLTLHRRVTRDVAQAIRARLTPQVRARLATTAPIDPQAHEAYLRGRYHWFRLSRAELDAALRYFELALEHDPEYALAYTGMAAVWGLRGHLGTYRPSEAFPRSKDAILKALELDPALPEAHAHVAARRFYVDWDWSGAEAAFEHAIALNPSHAELRVWHAELLATTGRSEEALEEMRRALDLDPLNSTFHAWLGQHLLMAGREDEGIAQLQDLLRRDPNAPLARGLLWGALARKGLYAEAFAQARQIAASSGDGELLADLDRGYAAGGYREAIRSWARIAARRSEAAYIPPERVARLYALAGEPDAAIDWLEKAFDEGSSQMVYLPAAGNWDGLREHPRFQNLLRRMQLPAQ
jgi:adenylate cyclase